MKTIFENTAANIIANIVCVAILPTSNIISNMENGINAGLFLNPNFIASIIIGIFLIFLLQFCRKLYLTTKQNNSKIKIYEFLNRKMYHQFNEFGVALKKQGIEVKKIKITETEKILFKDLPEDLKQEINNFLSI